MAYRRILCALVMSVTAACGAARDPQEPNFPVPPPPPVTRAMPAPVLSRYQQPQMPKVSTPKRESITEPPAGLPLPKNDEERVARESPAEPRPALPTARLPDEVVLQLLEGGRSAFVRCFKKAINEDPTELSFKVVLRVELDGKGALTSASTNATTRTLDTCLVRMAAWLKFPASGKAIAVELPLFYQGN